MENEVYVKRTTHNLSPELTKALGICKGNLHLQSAKGVAKDFTQ